MGDKLDLDLEAMERRVHTIQGTEYDRSTWTGGMLDFITRTEMPALLNEAWRLRDELEAEIASHGVAERDADFANAMRANEQLEARVRKLEAENAALQPDARLGRAVRGMEDNSLLLNASLGSMKHWQRYTDAKVEWMYGDRCQIFAFLVGAGEIREDGYPGDDVWHHTPQAALGLEEGSGE